MRTWMAGCAAAALLAGMAAAQEPAGDGPVYLEAGVLVDDRENQLLIARGDVRMQSGTRILHADELEYNPQTGRVVARGNVRLFDGTAPAQTADRIELDDEMSEGVAYGFATLLENNGKAAAAMAVRRADGSVELTNGYYTACNLCEDGSEEPTWRLRAGRVVRDLDDQMVYYRDVRLEVLGQPILYSPVFAHADPSTPRRSGFLIPSVDISDRLGFAYKQPYLWAISPYSDLVVSPRLMTEVAPVVELDYRRRFYSGQFAFEGSATYEQFFIDPDEIADLPASDPRVFDEDGFYGDEQFQWHVFAEGRFEISPGWRWGFGIQEVSDDLYLRRYDYSEQPDLGSGIYEFAARTLASQAYVQGQGRQFYADLAIVKPNSLLENVDDDTLPVIAPLGRLMSDLPFPAWAGLLEGEISTASLTRNIGDDYLRASVAARWSRATLLPGGIRVEPYALTRLDAYALSEADTLGNEIDSRNFTRALAAGGVDITWPFARVDSWGSTILAPRAHLVAASGIDDEHRAPNEDSQVLDLDSVSLFARNRSGGYDIWEDGTRADLGLTAEIDTLARYVPDVEIFAGRSLRLDNDPVYGPGTGLDQTESDWVAEISVDLGYLDIASRNRLDSETGELNRTDIVATADFWRVTSDVRYTSIEPELPGGRERSDIQFTGRVQINPRWSAGGGLQHDLDDEITRQATAFLAYQDECTRLEIVYERKNFEVGDLGASNSIRFRLTLFTLGSLQDE